MKGKGILIGDDFDLKIEVQKDSSGKITGGLVIGNSLYQNQALILILQPGELKLNPSVGVGLENMVADDDFGIWRQKIRKQLEFDGQKVKDVKFGMNQQLVIDANYN